MDFKSINDEQWREYIFPSGCVVRVEGVELNVSPSGGHRIKSVDGMAHYIPSGWVHLRWLPKPGRPAFAF